MKALISTLALSVLAISSFTGSAALAGDGVTTLECHSPSGKTSVHGSVTDGGEVVFQYTLQNADDKGSSEYGYLNYMARINTGDGSESAVQAAYPGIKPAAIVRTTTKLVKSFTVVTINPKGQDEEQITLNSIDGSIQTSGTRGDTSTAFRAILNGRDPRVTNDYKWLSPIQLSCTMKYSI